MIDTNNYEFEQLGLMAFYLFPYDERGDEIDLKDSNGFPIHWGY